MKDIHKGRFDLIQLNEQNDFMKYKNDLQNILDELYVQCILDNEWFVFENSLMLKDMSQHCSIYINDDFSIINTYISKNEIRLSGKMEFICKHPVSEGLELCLEKIISMS